MVRQQTPTYPARPPGTPPERVALLRKAFDQLAADPEMRADSEKIGIRVDAISGVQAQATIAKLYTTPEDVRARMQSIVQLGK